MRHRQEIEEMQGPKTSSGMFEAQAPEPSEEVEPEPEVPDEVQDSPVPSQGDSVPNSVEDKSSQVPSTPLPVAAPLGANIFMFGLLKHMTNLVGILTTQLKPNEAATSGFNLDQGSKKVPD